MNTIKPYISLLVLCSCWVPSWAAARDYVVHVSLVDGRTVTRADHKLASKILRKKHADLDLVSFAIQTRDAQSNAVGPQEIRRQLRSRFDEIAFEGRRRVRQLVLVGDLSNDADKTTIPNLGTFGAAGPDPDLYEAFAPLAGHFSPRARVVLLGGPSLPNDGAEAGLRARGWLRSLRAPDASLFGAHTGVDRNRPGLNRARAIKVGAASLGLGLAVALAAGLGGEKDAVFQIATLVSFNSFALLAPAWILGLRARGWLHEWKGLINVGKLVQLNDGEVSDVRTLRASFDRDKVFTCDEILASRPRSLWQKLKLIN